MDRWDGLILVGLASLYTGVYLAEGWPGVFTVLGGMCILVGLWGAQGKGR